MSRASVLARGRAAAEASMVDSCRIERATGQSTDGNGVVTTTWSTVYSGKCRVQQSDNQARQEEPGEAYVLMVRRELQLPVAISTDVRAEDRVTITACINDADLVGRTFTVRGEAAASEKTSRRLGLEEVTS